MARLSDTSPEAERVVIEAYRRMPVGRKWGAMGQTYADARVLHLAGFQQRNPGRGNWDAHREWLTVHLGFTGRVPIFDPGRDWAGLNLRTVREVARAFDDHKIPYALGGSMASSLYGFLRHTRGADFMAGPFPGAEAAFAAALGPDYDLSPEDVRGAVLRRSSFTLFNVRAGVKVDVFVRKDAPFEITAMQRRTALQFSDVPGQRIVFHTPEDALLFKLWWYRLSDERAEKHWSDVLGVLKVQAGKLDQAYLDHWAADLGVADLLARARQESEP